MPQSEPHSVTAIVMSELNSMSISLSMSNLKFRRPLMETLLTQSHSARTPLPTLSAFHIHTHTVAPFSQAYHHWGNPPHRDSLHMRVLHIVVVSPMLPCLPVILLSPPLSSLSFPSPFLLPFFSYPLLCWPSAGTSYFSLCWCNNLKSHNKATYCWHRDRAAWLLLLLFPLPFFLSLSPLACCASA